MKNTVLLFLCLLLSSSSFAQKANDQAEEVYDNMGYGKYIELKGKKDLQSLSLKELKQMAESYRKIGDYQGAEEMYRILLESDDKPEYHFYYAQCLQSAGRYLRARSHFLTYHEKMEAQAKQSGISYDGHGKALALGCDKIHQFRAYGGVKLENQAIANSPKLDFSPAYYKDGVVFVSTRGPEQPNKMDKWINDNFMDLYYGEIGRMNMLDYVEPFSPQLNTRYHEGPVSFTADNQKIFFTRNNFLRGKRGKSSNNVTKMKIYSARMVNGRWEEIQELPFNSDEYDIRHPAISPDGRTLVFSREGGNEGQGGYDLYVSYFIGNQWTAPENLGAEVNTKGNEGFPFIHEDGSLFFASDGHPGLGGLDVFLTQKVTVDNDSSWIRPLNIGVPFNSKKDDFGLILHRDQQSGYFSSNREGGKGGDDLYFFETAGRFTQVTPNKIQSIRVCVFNSETGERVPNASVTVMTEAQALKIEQTGRLNNNMVVQLEPIREDSQDFILRLKDIGAKHPDQVEQFTTDGSGEFIYYMQTESRYIFEASKPGYNTGRETYTVKLTDDAQDLQFCIPLKKRGISAIQECPLLNGFILNKDYNRPMPGATVTLLNRCNGEEITLPIDLDGSFETCLECGCDYVVKGRKENFIGDNALVSTIDNPNCNTPISVELEMVPGFDKMGNPVEIAGNVLDQSIKVGTVIELKNIFYDYDKANIREEAGQDLDELVALMNRFPSMSIELSSHTDSRGSDTYNQELSQQRANAARSYLIGKGIAADRIEAVGFGESRLRNRCKNGVNCSDMEHQINRRTEVFVTEFDKSEYVRIYYRDNKPAYAK